MAKDLGARLVEVFKGTLHRASAPFWHTDFLPTGIQSVDCALGGGFGYGRLVELFGSWSTGKTMLLYYALINNQRILSKSGRPGKSILFEAEGAFTPAFFELLGGDPDELLVYPVDTVEEVFDSTVGICKLMMELAKKGDDTPVAIGWDGIAATGTQHLQDVDLTTRDMTKAGLMSFGTQKITTMLKKCRVAFIATNQVREKIGSMSSETHTPGGKAYPFHCSQRVELILDGGNKGSMIWNSGDTVELGRWVRGVVVKNKLASPFGKFSIPIYIRDDMSHPEYGSPLAIGINREEALFYTYIRNRFIFDTGEPVVSGPNGSWYAVSSRITGGDEKKFQKKDWLQMLSDYPRLWNLVYEPKVEEEDEVPAAG